MEQDVDTIQDKLYETVGLDFVCQEDNRIYAEAARGFLFDNGKDIKHYATWQQALDNIPKDIKPRAETSALITAPEGRCIMTLGYNAWGKGATSHEALRAWRKNASTGRDTVATGVILINAPSEAWVDDMGSVQRNIDSEPSFELCTIDVEVW